MTDLQRMIKIRIYSIIVFVILMIGFTIYTGFWIFVLLAFLIMTAVHLVLALMPDLTNAIVEYERLILKFLRRSLTFVKNRIGEEPLADKREVDI